MKRAGMPKKAFVAPRAAAERRRLVCQLLPGPRRFLGQRRRCGAFGKLLFCFSFFVFFFWFLFCGFASDPTSPLPFVRFLLVWSFFFGICVVIFFLSADFCFDCDYLFFFFFGRPNDSIAAGILLHRRRTPRGAFAPGPWRTRDGQVRRTGQEPSNTMEK